ncbi:dihydroorotase [Meiothermus sp. CFH 77666]|uniref:dihydroorotase n=1 Tax=Meiothermus sp. CFH 77666 TaxID=2817942 RepID=UPI001AA03704|nr:dihydroorotase [Meiothermus sp. CFH 77666]MBO1437692.1 dihydroorotase [Meiothermus sp. CFH 77666]
MKGEILIKNAKLVDGRGEHGQADVLIGEGRILSLSGGEASTVLDATGKVLSPGFFDPHAHLREPGQEVKEDLQSGLAAAVRGGYTDVVSMPNTTPVVDSAEIVRALKEKAARLGRARLHPAAALTQGQEGKVLSEARLLREAGAVMLTDDGRTNEDAGVLAQGLQYAASWGLLVSVHAEDAGLRRGGVMNEGAVSFRLGLPGNTGYAEAARIARDLEILRYVMEGPGARGLQPGRSLLHIQHLSTRRGLELLRQAKQAGLPVSTEVGPHHLTLTDEHLESLNPIYKVAPPLRTQADVEALMEGLLDGSIDCIGTDHAPHTQDEKELDMLRAPFGIPNIEVCWPLLYTELVGKRGFPLPTLIERFTDGPRRLLGFSPVHLIEGGEASLVLWSPGEERPVEPHTFASKAKYSPWAGWVLRGWPSVTLVEGCIVYLQQENR